MGTAASSTAATSSTPAASVAPAGAKSLNTTIKTDRVGDNQPEADYRKPNSENMNTNDSNEHSGGKSKNTNTTVKNDDKANEYIKEEHKTKETLKLTEDDVPDKTTFKEYHTQSIEALRNAIKRTKTLQSVTDDDGKIHSKIVNLISLISELYWIPENVDAQPKDIKNHRIGIANIFVNDKIIQTIYEVLNCFHKAGNVMSTRTYAIYRTCLAIIQNYTDKCENVCNEICMTDGFVEMFKTILVENRESYLNNSATEHMHYIVRKILSIMHNITMKDSCITRIRHIGFTEVIQAYLMSEDNKDKLTSLSILAPIIEEKDKDIISANTDTVLLLLDYLKNGLDEKMRRYNGWSCTECALVTRYLAANDDNKKVLVNAGCLELLVKFGKTAVDDDEKLESVGAIWALAFDPDIRKAMISDKELSIVDLLLKLKDSDSQKLKQMCAGALWTIREEHKSSNTNGATDVNNTKSNDGHIMISYQWDDQKTVIKIRDCLENAGLKVWIDINEMKGSINTAMAGAVENANVFLMCMSQKYQNSLNCQLEADYASTLTKTILPLKLERDYKPRSWTGLLCGSQKYYEFTGKYKFDSKMKELLRDLAQTKTNNGPIKALDHHPLSTVPEDVTDSALPVAMATPISYSSHVSDVTIDTIRGWTQTDVQKWIEKKNLKSCGINKRTGEEIALFITLRSEYPEYFYRCLETMWKVKDSLTLAKIVWALKDLTKELEQTKSE